MRTNRRLALVGFAVALSATACSTYPHNAQDALSAFYSGDYPKAAELLEKKSQDDGKDQVLFLFDRGMALQLAGNYKESEKVLLQADRLTEVKDYTSLSTEAATLLVSDKIKQYKGEDFEKVLINGFLAIDYVMQRNLDDALVECRRVNQKLVKYINEAKRNYEQNPFARYLSATIWEASGHYEDAYIDYVQAQKLVPDYPYLKGDLIRLAKKLNRDDDLKKWTNLYGANIPSAHFSSEKNTGELIVIIQQGKSAIKHPNPAFTQIPKFYPRGSFTKSAEIEVDGVREQSQKIYSVSDVAVKTLDDAYTALIAKKSVGLVGKYLVAEQMRQQNPILGLLTWIGLNAADEADTRSWTTLPETLQFIRLRVTPGSKTIKVRGLDISGNPTGEEKTFIAAVRAREEVFLNWRTIR